MISFVLFDTCVPTYLPTTSNLTPFYFDLCLFLFLFPALFGKIFAERISPQRMQALLASPMLLREYELRQDAKLWKRKQQNKFLMHGKRLRDEWSPLVIRSSLGYNGERGPSLSPSSGYESLNDNASICSGDSLINKSPKKSLIMQLANGKRRNSSSHLNQGSAKKKKYEYVVETIDSVESINAEPVFFVKWLNYPASANTWESLENLAECALLDGFIESMTVLHDRAIAELTQEFEDQIKAENLCIKPSDLNMQEIEEYDPVKLKVDLILLAQFIKARSRSQKEPEKIRQRVLRSFLVEPLYYRRKQQLAMLEEWEVRMNMIEHKAPIAVENKFDLEILDPNFQYITKNFPGKGVELPIDPKIGCKCPDICAPSSKCCARLADSYFAYEKTGRLRIYPGEAIYECNDNCSCSEDCTNRVIQRGRQNSLCLFRTSNGRGWGVRTDKIIRKGEFVGEYVGEVITCEEADERGKQYDAVGRTYLFDLDYNTSADSMYTIDAAVHGNICHFFNHSCDPNLAVFPFWIDNLDINMPRLAFFSLRPIKPGEELTFDYIRGDLGIDDYENLSEAEKVSCRCGAANCRKVLF